MSFKQTKPKLGIAITAMLPVMLVACGKLTSVAPDSSLANNQTKTQQQPDGSTLAKNPTNPTSQKSSGSVDQDYVISLVAPTKNEGSFALVEQEDYSDLIPEVELKIPEKQQRPSAQNSAPKETPAQEANSGSNPKSEPTTNPKTKESQPAKPQQGEPHTPAAPTTPTKKEQTTTKVPSAPVPTQQSIRSQAVAYVDAGTLKTPASLLERQQTYREAPPFIVIAPGRDRFYGTTDLIETIDLLAQFVKSLSSSLRLVVSDLSGPAGGPLFQWDSKNQDYKKNNKGSPIQSHESHQNGLDADIAYLTNSPEAKPFADIRKMEDINSTLNLEAQFKLFKQAVSTEMIEAFFVDPVMKKEMCRQALREGAFKENQKKEQEDKLTIETLRRLVVEPQWHFNHFHMRLKCDKSRQSACLQRPDFVPKEHGCVFTKKESTN